MRTWFPQVTGLVAFRAGPRLQVMTALPSGGDQSSSSMPSCHPTPLHGFLGGKKQVCAWYLPNSRLRQWR